MNRARLGLVGAAAVGGGLALWSAFGLLRSRSAEQVDYIVERTIDDRTEVRRYPELVKVETTGSSNREAFFRLFDYIQGANESQSEVSMTAPVRTDDAGEEVSMTAPVRTDDDEDGVRMAFYLPVEYTPNTAPRPTHPGVSLAVESPRSVATRRFSWWSFDWRTRRQGAETPRHPRRERGDARRRTVQPRVRRPERPAVSPHERGRRRGRVVRCARGR